MSDIILSNWFLEDLLLSKNRMTAAAETIVAIRIMITTLLFLNFIRLCLFGNGNFYFCCKLQTVKMSRSQRPTRFISSVSIYVKVKGKRAPATEVQQLLFILHKNSYLFATSVHSPLAFRISSHTSLTAPRPPLLIVT